MNNLNAKIAKLDREYTARSLRGETVFALQGLVSERREALNARNRLPLIAA